MFPAAPHLRNAEYFVHGRGRGHASRCAAVSGALSAAGYEFTVHAGGDARQMLTDLDVPVLEREPLARGPLSLLRLASRAARDGFGWLRNPKPKLVVSDGDHAALLGARLASVPSLAIGHDVVFDARVSLWGDTQPPRATRRALRAQRLNGLPVRLATRWVGVHFLPAITADPRIRLARPDSPFSGEVTGRDGSLVCYFRDRNGLQIAERFAALGFEVVCFGEHGESPHVETRPFSKSGFRQALQRCSGVVCSAGSNVLAECVTLQKPMLALHRPRDAEQAINAWLIREAGVGMGCPFPLAAGALAEFAARLRSDDFATVDLVAALPPLSAVVAESLSSFESGLLD